MSGDHWPRFTAITYGADASTHNRLQPPRDSVYASNADETPTMMPPAIAKDSAEVGTAASTVVRG